ncbi:MAG: TetR/AcrR family transcriptional regulator [Liquorilactobacillus nagelii]|jgi:AcrR family transcriptional regulator|uniref:TetR/AcrR family transcriptional regulator n=1 Tax=Liquorilactobacillus nagelii TaxID=82688 RepID=UPI0039EBEA58
MVLANLSKVTDTKLQRINSALLKEFSSYPLNQAQVARIVKNADISRGSFYTYFKDLPDAYQYLYHQAMTAIHQPMPTASLTSNYQPEIYLQTASDFTGKIVNSRYYNLIKLHILYNEVILPQAKPAPALTLDARHWSAMTLSHATIRDILLQPAKRQAFLDRLAIALTSLVGQD